MEKHRETAIEAAIRERTDFSPLVRGGSSSCIHTLDRSGNGRIRVVPTGFGRFMGLLFFIIAAASSLPAILARQGILLVMPLIFSLFGIVFAVWIFRKRAVFDLTRGCFVRGKTTIPFARIVALQVVKEICRTKNSSFPSWELNLVLDDASRINVFDHGNRKRFDADLAILAEALGKPVWEKKSPSPPAEPGPIVLGLIGVALATGASLIFMLTTGFPLMQAAESRHWIAVPATVTESQLVTTRGSKGRRLYRIEITARYEWQGKEYECDRYDFFRSEMSSNFGSGEMRRIVKEHPVGRKCECLVDPENPAVAVMSREVPIWSVVLAALATLLFEALGIGLLVAAIRKKRKPAATGKNRRGSPAASMPHLRDDGSVETGTTEKDEDARS